jgi:glutamine synthetase
MKLNDWRRRTGDHLSLGSSNLMDLPTGDLVQAEYIWIGGSGMDVRCKTRTLSSAPKSVQDLPEWNYDGSSTGQAPGKDSEVIMKPRAIFRDPFRRGDHILVLCDTYTPAGEPLPTNTRASANEIFENPKVKEEEPWFGMEQEYTMFSMNKWPLGWPQGGFPGPQGPYYCSVGADNAFGRPIVEAHYRACLYAGVKISGINGEVMPGQWEFQVGPCLGIEMGDHLWIARYLMHRVAEEFGVVISFDPKPIPGDWNGAGCHCNYSTKSTRADGGYKHVLAQIDRLAKKHSEHIAVYGLGNERRLTGAHETSPIDRFDFGVANRGCSIRIPRDCEKNQKGYYEDRRPASNCDPYVISSKIAHTTLA